MVTIGEKRSAATSLRVLGAIAVILLTTIALFWLCSLVFRAGSPISAAPGVLAGALRSAVSMHNQRMELHALVLDQDDRPIPRARLLLSLRDWFVLPQGMFSSKTRDQWVNSDEHGRVYYAAGRGDSIMIMEVHQNSQKLEMKTIVGIRYEATAREKGEIPTKQKPLVLKVWVPGERTPVLEWGAVQYVLGSTEVYVDVVGGIISTQALASADFLVKCPLRPLDPANPRMPPDWGVQEISVEAFDGGLVETDDRFLYRPPPSGYTNKIARKDWKTFSPGTTYSWDVPFYFRIRDKFFGSLQVKLVSIPQYSDSAPFGLVVEARFALDGSRHLENDPVALDRLGSIDRKELSRSTLRSAKTRGVPPVK